MKELLNLTKLFKKSKNRKKKLKNSNNIDNNSKDNNIKKSESQDKETECLLEKLELEKAMFLRSTRRTIEKTYYKDLLES
uniref:Uncharacterized protein n=1 Tax=viral metagenome TaxID=1070528 RepID=A0A6C0IXN4_9ZZZZ